MDWRSLAGLYVVASCVEWAYAVVSPDLEVLGVSGYARIAVPLGAAALFAWGQQVDTARPRLEWLGSHSLGIYSLHDTIWLLLAPAVPALPIALGDAVVSIEIIAFSMSTLGTVWLVRALARTRLRQFVV